MHRVVIDGGVYPAPMDRVADGQIEPLRERPGTAVDGDGEQVGAWDVAVRFEEHSEHEDPVGWHRAVCGIDDERAGELAVGPVAILDGRAVAGRGPVVVGARFAGLEVHLARVSGRDGKRMVGGSWPGLEAMNHERTAAGKVV